MLYKVIYGGAEYFAIRADEAGVKWRLHDGTKVAVSDLRVDLEKTEQWQAVYESLPVLVAYAFERKVEVYNGKCVIDMDGELYMGLLGENPVVGVTTTLLEGISQERYTAEYRGPEMRAAFEQFWESIIRGYHLQPDVLVLNSVNALLDMLAIACLPTTVPAIEHGFSMS